MTSACPPLSMELHRGVGPCSADPFASAIEQVTANGLGVQELGLVQRLNGKAKKKLTSFAVTPRVARRYMLSSSQTNNTFLKELSPLLGLTSFWFLFEFQRRSFALRNIHRAKRTSCQKASLSLHDCCQGTSTWKEN